MPPGQVATWLAQLPALQESAEVLLSRYWPAVEALARALEAAGELAGTVATALLAEQGVRALK